eukprot:93021-Lingulodinium_polyedra.AAC.1
MRGTGASGRSRCHAGGPAGWRLGSAAVKAPSGSSGRAPRASPRPSAAPGGFVLEPVDAYPGGKYDETRDLARLE